MVVFLGVDVYEDRATVQDFHEEFQIPFRLLIDPTARALTRRFALGSMPQYAKVKTPSKPRPSLVLNFNPHRYFQKVYAILRTKKYVASP